MNENFEFLDMLNMLSFAAQIENLESDERQGLKIERILKVVFTEINNLHKENYQILERLDKIVEKINELKE